MSAGLRLSSVAFLATAGEFTGTALETFEAYTPEQDVDGSTLVAGTGLGAAAIPIPYDGVVAKDDFQAYTPGSVGVLTEGFGWATDSVPMTKLLLSLSVPSGASPQTVSITCPTYSSASIYYTTNGTTPTTSSTLYTGSFSASDGTTVKVIAVATNFITSEVYSVYYYAIVAGAALWLRADSLANNPALLDGDPASSWADQSGNGNNATQSTASKYPLFKTNVVNGLPVLRFDAADDALVTPLNLAANPFTIFIVYSYRSATSAGRRAIAGGNNWLMGPYNNAYQVYNGGFISSPPAVTQNAFVLHQYRQTALLGEHWTAKTLRGSNVTPASTPGIVNIGAAGAFPAEFLNGDVAEVIIYTSALSEANRQIVENAISTKYGL